MDYKLNDIVTMKKSCPNCKTNKWKIIRTGADIRIKCMECGKSILMTRFKFADEVKSIFKVGKALEKTEGIPDSLEGTKIGDIVIFRDSFKCPNHVSSWFEEAKWTIIQIRPDIIVKCNKCGCEKELKYDAYLSILKSNRSLRSRHRSERKKINKGLEKQQKNEMIKSQEYQIKAFGKILQNDDLVILKDKYECQNCHKNIFRIVSMPKIVTSPVKLICFSCKNLVKNEYTSDLNEIDKNIHHSLEDLIKDTTVKTLLSDLMYDEKSIVCPNCGNVHAKLVSGSYFPMKTYKIKCNACESVKSFEMDRNEFFNNIVTTDIQKIMEISNNTFISLTNNDNRISKQKDTYNSITEAIKKGNIVLTIQLIDSPYNHVTAIHKIENRVISIAYQSNGTIKTFDYKCHYCKTCHKYFDFKSSFETQLKTNNILLGSLLINLKRSINSSTSSYNDFETFNSETLLHSLGYRVGYSGLKAKERQRLLKTILDQEVLSIAEIKSTINLNITRFSNRLEYTLAVKEWKDDIQFLNELILNQKKQDS